MHRLRSAVYFNLNGLHVGFPHLIGSSMRMTHVITEMNTFFTDIALCHFAAPPLNPIRPHLTATQNIHIIPEQKEKSKENLKKVAAAVGGAASAQCRPRQLKAGGSFRSCAGSGTAAG